MIWLKYVLGIVTGFTVNLFAIDLFAKSVSLSIVFTLLLYVFIALIVIYMMKKLGLTDDGFTITYIIGNGLAFIYYEMANNYMPDVTLTILRLHIGG